ncbi:MAG: outer membrane protein assembly factor BamA, partial [Chitinophagales bacterium]
KGFQLEWSGGVGLNKIKVNQSIASLIGFDGEPLQNKYDSLALKKINYALGFHLSQFIPIRKRGTFLLRNVSKLYIAKNILNNEKYRIGGYRLLRGFDEEAIYTPYYSIFTSEFRFLLSQNSFFNVFADIAIVEDEQKGPGNIDVPIGFGMGVALQTRGGIFSLSYALGKNLDNKIEFRNGKIHFGFISLF